MIPPLVRKPLQAARCRASVNPAMDSPFESPGPPAPLEVRLVCAVGAMGLAVAMGIGRFAFTPLLPAQDAISQVVSLPLQHH